MGLSVREILILDYFDGKPVHAKMPSYLYATYGSDADLCLDRLYADGWIRESTPRETVNMLPLVGSEMCIRDRRFPISLNDTASLVKDRIQNLSGV